MSIALISRFKNERHILYEWVHHHLAEGIDKFYLIDDNSDDEFLKLNDWLVQYIKRGVVEIHQSQLEQKDDYDRWLPSLRHYTWLVQIDLDEFVFCPAQDTNLKTILAQRFGNIDYIRINWKLFQHQSKLQPKSVIEDNVVTHEQDKDPSSAVGLKCIAKTEYLANIRIHRCDFSRNVEVVQLGSHNPDIQINHYRAQSDEFLYGVKVGRGGGVNKRAYQGGNLKQKLSGKFTKQDFLLKRKRAELIGKCNARVQVRPKISDASSEFKP